MFSSPVAKLKLNFYMDRTMFSEGIVNIEQMKYICMYKEIS